MMGVMTAQADDYPYLTFETNDGNLQSVPTENLTLGISDGKLVVNDGTYSYPLTSLTKMYFTTDNVTGIAPLLSPQGGTINSPLEETEAIWYTLDGRMLNGKPTTKGIYINQGRKVVIK